MPNNASSQEQPNPQASPPPKLTQELTKPVGFFGEFITPFLRASPWTKLVNTEALTPAQAGKLQALATVRTAGITGGFALLAGLAATGAAGFVWLEQKKLDAQTEELAKKKNIASAKLRATWTSKNLNRNF